MDNHEQITQNNDSSDWEKLNEVEPRFELENRVAEKFNDPRRKRMLKGAIAALILAAGVAIITPLRDGGNNVGRRPVAEVDMSVEAINYNRHPSVFLEDGTSLSVDFTDEELSSPENFKEVMDTVLTDELVVSDVKETLDKKEQGEHRSTIIDRKVDDGARGRSVRVNGAVEYMSDNKGFSLNEEWADSHVENMNEVHGPGVELENGQMAWTNTGDNKRWAGILDEKETKVIDKSEDIDLNLAPAPKSLPPSPPEELTPPPSLEKAPEEPSFVNPTPDNSQEHFEPNPVMSSDSNAQEHPSNTSNNDPLNPFGF